MAALKLDKLLKFAEGNPMYVVRRLGDLIELRAVAPSMQDAAASSDASEPEPQERYVVVLFRESNGEVEPMEAYIEAGEERRPISLDEIRWWLDVIDSMT